jgi:DnaA family protein
MNNPTQVIFPFQVDQRASFSNFFCTSKNSDFLNHLQQRVSSENFYEIVIDGIAGSGKSFLMQSICNELGAANKRFAYVPMSKAIKLDVEILQNLASLDVVCIDDLQLVKSQKEWETAIFHLINECQQARCSLIFSVSSNASIDELVILPDLLSRFKRMEHMKLKAVGDEDLREALIFVSQSLDINLEFTELDFLLKHHEREFSGLVKNIILLDQRAGALKRKITIPLIKETLSI